MYIRTSALKNSLGQLNTKLKQYKIPTFIDET